MKVDSMTEIPAGTWAIDPIHTSVEFRVKHLGISTYSGRFNEVSGTIVTGAGSIDSVDGTAKAASVAVSDEGLIGHLKSPDFFDADANPDIKFVSKSVTLNGDTLTMTGDFTLRGVTKELELKGELEGVGNDLYGNTKLGVTAEGVINRGDFGLNFNAALDSGAQAVGERVKLLLHVEAVKQ